MDVTIKTVVEAFEKIANKSGNQKEENKMKILVVDANKDETFINKILVDEGKHRGFRIIKGNFTQQAEQIVREVLEERPKKLIVDRIGMGKGLLDAIHVSMEPYGLKLCDDATVVY